MVIDWAHLPQGGDELKLEFQFNRHLVDQEQLEGEMRSAVRDARNRGISQKVQT